MVYQLCKGVALCHGHSVRHHDLDPHNLQIGEWGMLLLSQKPALQDILQCMSLCRGQGCHGQPRRMVLASDEQRLFDIGTEEEDGHRRRTEHLSSSRLVRSFRRSSSTATNRHHRSNRATVEGMLYFCQPSPDYVCP
ncbi:uncharacterized protein LOC119366150 [Triticum dicoccoides]|uniref:uncharacterized protein LOC119366150 n=1 Tax=Triticum dicoccoides TaxID=85692 RepID=UPI00188DD659|nr:uncharacterized protein LOC119366150 [Triticum dicoccoides]XP_037487731.1 uncharacterized protein LOC119366150 [Triticum dicoccoides]